MILKKRELVLLVLLTFIVGLVGAYTGLKIFQPNVAKPNTQAPFQSSISNYDEDYLHTIKKAYDLINQHYIEDIDEQQLLEGAIQGMLETLEDPYSSYMNADAMERFNEQIQSSFEGIGAEVSKIDGKVTIVAPIKNSPAEKAGLRPNDQILKVDDEDLEGLDLNEAVEKIRGEKGSKVVLLIQRQGTSEPFEVTITRDEIPIETVYASTENVDGKKTGIIEITTFSETTADEFNKAISKLEKDGIEGLVIDVRGNPGGLLDSIEEILQQFIPKDIPYLQIEDGNGKVEKFYTKLDKKKPYPISVLIDEGSASASEILAVAMKEVGYDVVGMTSFGKGTVQQAVPLGEKEEGTIKLTFYKWLSPKGNWINEKGVEPTIEQKQPEFYYANPIKVEEPFKIDQTDENIKNAQIMLQGIGYDPKRMDGYFDQNTMEAIMRFQQEHGLTANGELNSETAYAIESKVLDIIRNGEQDLQLEKALETLYE